MKHVPISSVIPNKTNPRIIKDDKFKKLVQSIKEFPQMLELRPIVVDSDMVVLGGNMRLKACQAAGLVEVPIIIANELTDEQKQEFIIKDNVGFGEWDWDVLANEWDALDLDNWGLDVPGGELSEKKESYRIEILLESMEQREEVYNELLSNGFNVKVKR